MNFSVTQNGKSLSKSKYSWDEKTKVFSTDEDNLVLDFSDGSYCTFKTGSYCTFDTGSYCTFKTGSYCTFKTGHNCTFKTGDNCFVTRWDVKGCDEIPINKTIKLNGDRIKGYTVVAEVKEEVKEITCDGKIVEVDGNKYRLVKVT
jgi:hypothetical protein